MTEVVIEVGLFIAGAIITILLAVFGFWFKLHHRQESKIESLQQTNGKEHADLHKKIDRLDEKSEQRGVATRQAVDQVMQHLLKVK